MCPTDKPQQSTPFKPSTFTFLKRLAKHNQREWFKEHQDAYERDVREPSLALIRMLDRPLTKVAPFFPAVAKKVGGSLMRIHRDTRFSKNKAPYKTNIGIYFRHDAGKDIHAPGFYIHIEPGECFLGAGCYRPAGEAVNAIRQAIIDDPLGWGRVRNDKQLQRWFGWGGESLKTAPRGIAKDHPQIEDLRRKDYVLINKLTTEEVLGEDFPTVLIERIKATRPLMRFLCRAAGVPY